MKGLVIATHADLGAELLRACELIIGPVKYARAISVQRDNGVEQVQELFQTAIQEVGIDGEGVLIMTDMLGGTPANIGAAYIKEGEVDILTGVNLPMVLKFFNSEIIFERNSGFIPATGSSNNKSSAPFARQQPRVNNFCCP